MTRDISDAIKVGKIQIFKCCIRFKSWCIPLVTWTSWQITLLHICKTRSVGSEKLEGVGVGWGGAGFWGRLICGYQCMAKTRVKGGRKAFHSLTHTHTHTHIHECAYMHTYTPAWSWPPGKRFLHLLLGSALPHRLLGGSSSIHSLGGRLGRTGGAWHRNCIFQQGAGNSRGVALSTGSGANGAAQHNLGNVLLVLCHLSGGGAGGSGGGGCHHRSGSLVQWGGWCASWLLRISAAFLSDRRARWKRNGDSNVWVAALEKQERRQCEFYFWRTQLHHGNKCCNENSRIQIQNTITVRCVVLPIT